MKEEVFDEILTRFMDVEVTILSGIWLMRSK